MEGELASVGRETEAIGKRCVRQAATEGRVGQPRYNLGPRRRIAPDHVVAGAAVDTVVAAGTAQGVAVIRTPDLMHADQSIDADVGGVAVISGSGRAPVQIDGHRILGVGIAGPHRDAVGGGDGIVAGAALDLEEGALLAAGPIAGNSDAIVEIGAEQAVHIYKCVVADRGVAGNRACRARKRRRHRAGGVPVIGGVVVAFAVQVAAGQQVVAGAAIEEVAAGAAIERVIAVAALQHIVADTAGNGVVAGAADQNVVAAGRARVGDQRVGNRQQAALAKVVGTAQKT